MFDRIKAKEKSKTLIRDRSICDVFGFWVIIAIMPMAIFAAAMITTTVGGTLSAAIASASLVSSFSSSAAGYILSRVLPIVVAALAVILLGGFAALIVSLLFKVGMNRSALRMNRGDTKVRVLDIILAGDSLGKYMSVALWQILINFVWNIPSIVLIVIPIIIGSTSAVPGVFNALVVIAFLWSIFISVYKYCEYFFAFHVAEDRRETRAFDCLSESSKLTKGHIGELLLTMLSFLGWDIIALTGIGNIFVLPYKYLTYTSIYEQLIGSFVPVHPATMVWLYNGPVTASPEGSAAPLPEVPANIPQNSNAAPQMPAADRTIEIISGEFAGASIPVKAGEVISIGRDQSRANIVTSPENTLISGLHCTILYNAQSDSYIVTDYSSNGTWLNNFKLVPQKPASAGHGSLVKLANGAMVLRLG